MPLPKKTEASIRKYQLLAIFRKVSATEPVAKITMSLVLDQRICENSSSHQPQVMMRSEICRDRDANATGVFPDLTNQELHLYILQFRLEVKLLKIKTKTWFGRKCWF